MIAFDCPHCGKPLQSPPETAGRKGRCLHCRQIIRIPEAHEWVTHADPLASDAAKVTLAPPSDEIASPPSQPAPPPQPATNSDNRLLPKSSIASDSIDPEIYDFLAPAEDPTELGRLGSYVVREVLGVGGMGVVFRAEDPQLKRSVALKALLPALAASQTHRKRFLREAQAVASLENDHIVTIFQVGEDRGIPYFAMQLLEGESLDRRCRREPILPVVEILQIAREIADGLAAAHRRGMVHRDIKPANIWLETRKPSSGTTRTDRTPFRIKLLDFGLAHDATETDSRITRLGTIVGTPAYMAPEQARGQTVDTRTDLFSLGTVLYQLCTGDVPFLGENTQEVLSAVTQATPQPLRKLNSTIPIELIRLINRLLEKNPADRPESAQVVLDLLQAIAIPSDAGKTGFTLVPETEDDSEADLPDATILMNAPDELPRPIAPRGQSPERSARDSAKEPAKEPAPARPRSKQPPSRGERGDRKPPRPSRPPRSRRSTAAASSKSQPRQSHLSLWFASMIGAILGGLVLLLLYWLIQRTQPEIRQSPRPFLDSSNLPLPIEEMERLHPSTPDAKRPPRL
ncbi:serine/threonine-protein kinase [Tuwongella immobilis]|uniref:Protein kinase domain-containing protein n=1 Tax=Tuwongella immobilis TaxID=692036 RepID=A0A6C2YND8_9BACT|nr:serine/threonine-protein kinase [Tuwongella immobilis]VIP02904.1 serine threonine protein partial : Uncultured bacterium genome assembly Metasoil_fosmids_resub OS=uncultured bacterium PE=4 SV=1: Pkinase [Tuwongella immobilis]VTS02800.1 serine threonine protein partial : Uncultured bacterium genome assembly Metasoil_fosmids_resub OS=uncultured bacterium PE=4 SV=1: Pkinase [Tuwongella immobilis]